MSVLCCIYYSKPWKLTKPDKQHIAYKVQKSVFCVQLEGINHKIEKNIDIRKELGVFSLNGKVIDYRIK